MIEKECAKIHCEFVQRVIVMGGCFAENQGQLVGEMKRRTLARYVTTHSNARLAHYSLWETLSHSAFLYCAPMPLVLGACLSYTDFGFRLDTRFGQIFYFKYTFIHVLCKYFGNSNGHKFLCSPNDGCKRNWLRWVGFV